MAKSVLGGFGGLGNALPLLLLLATLLPAALVPAARDAAAIGRNLKQAYAASFASAGGSPGAAAAASASPGGIVAVSSPGGAIASGPGLSCGQYTVSTACNLCDLTSLFSTTCPALQLINPSIGWVSAGTTIHVPPCSR